MWCYLAPQFQQLGLKTVKSDIFKFMQMKNKTKQLCYKFNLQLFYKELFRFNKDYCMNINKQ